MLRNDAVSYPRKRPEKRSLFPVKRSMTEVIEVVAVIDKLTIGARGKNQEQSYAKIGEKRLQLMPLTFLRR